jgi:phospholipid/cholesterol/gamma-HCH transport system ATP-binding protein
MIEVNNVFMKFEGKEVLTNINTNFLTGKINMVIGSSGSGKTVLLKCVVGLLQPTKGEIIYDGRNFTNMDYYAKKDIRHEIGMLFQGGALFNSLTVEENVGFPLKMFTKKTSKEVTDRVNFCLDRVNLSKVNRLFPSEISGGMQKRVGIARAIVMNPRYMFCDEPNSGLDPKTSRVIDELIREITAEFKTTTIVNSHDMASVFAIADKVLFIHKGQKWWEGASNEISKSKNAELLQMIEASGQDMDENI